MSLKQVSTKNAPAAIGPYSQAVIAGDFMYISGQIPVNPENSKVVEGGIEEQTRQVLENIKAILAEAGKDFSSVVKVEIFLADIEDFKTVNGIYAEYFTSDPKPARQAVEVANLPLYVKIEISCIAYMA